MSDIAIQVEGLGKRYQIGERDRYGTLYDTLSRAATAPVRALRGALGPTRSANGASPPESHIWAVKDVSFQVKEGELLGIIGRNGSGKSTLLKIISRITEPTEGFAEVRGKVGSLLEVGAGFHPELTGRENIFLNGAILGMTKGEIVRKFDEIVAFSEIEKFIDTPVKRYSRGMYLRLAFAVAAHLEPEVLLVDEVLAVGDAAFQQKCLGKMEDVGKGGRTVLFVSHNMPTVASLTRTCIWLDSGRIVELGDTADVVRKYLDFSLRHGAQDGIADLRAHPKGRSDCQDACRFTQVRLLRDDGSTSGTFYEGEPMTAELEFRSQVRTDNLDIRCPVFTLDGIRVLTLLFNTGRAGVREGEHRVAVTLPRIGLRPGSYRLGLVLVTGLTVQDYVEDAIQFTVTHSPEGYGHHALRGDMGLVTMEHSWGPLERV